jgi:cysteine desulfurase/selenocysteine lyase
MNRNDFPMLNQDIIYFDNGATTLKPKCVIDAMNDYYSNYSANAHRGDYDISYKVDVTYEAARKSVANFINAELDEVVFTSGCTESLNIIANGFFSKYLSQGDEVLITYAEHASNVLPWFKLAQELGIIIKYIKLNDIHEVTMESVMSSITPNTKVISLAYSTNVIGDVRPIKEIAEFAHKNNIFLVVDGAQSVPHMKTDVKELDCDFLAFSLHKMCGPTGVGVLYGKRELLEEVTPINLGGGMNESFDSYDQVVLKELPTRLEAGTPNIAGVIGSLETINYLNSIGMDNIHKYELELKEYLVSKLVTIPHIKLINQYSKSGIVSFVVDDIFAQDVAYYLNKYHICVRAGNHCAKILKDEIGIKNTIRVSLYFYNTKEEIDKLVDLLKDKDKIIREMI